MAHQVVLSWSPSTDTVDGYNVYRSATSGTESSPALNGTTPVTSTTFTDSTAVAGVAFYVVKSTLNGVESVPSNEVSSSIAPAPPSSLSISSQS